MAAILTTCINTTLLANQWSPITNFQFGGIDALSCFAIDTVLYLAAGRDANTFFTECWSYHPQKRFMGEGAVL